MKTISSHNWEIYRHMAEERSMSAVDASTTDEVRSFIGKHLHSVIWDSLRTTVHNSVEYAASHYFKA
jgi:hypothetical protein